MSLGQNSIILQNINSEELLSQIRSIISEEISKCMKPDVNSEYLTKKETAAKLRISLPTLQRMTKAGSIAGYRVGKRVLYRSDSVEEALKSIDTLKYKRS